MKTLFITFALALAAANSKAGEHYTLVAQNQQNQQTDTESITLNQGDTAELTYSSWIPEGISGPIHFRMLVTVGGKTLEIPSLRERSKNSSSDVTYETNPVKVAGPAVLKMRLGLNGGGIPASTAFATVEVNRAGTAGTPTGIPLEAGTTWQVILESSTDLVNWTPAAPGDYPSGTPTRFFRTRLVKRP
jgi:hypothetical protein